MKNAREFAIALAATDLGSNIVAIAERDTEIRLAARDEMTNEVRESMALHDRQVRAAALREAADFLDFPIMEREFSVELRRMADRWERGE